LSKVLSFEGVFLGGLDVRTRLLVPVRSTDPTGGALVEGMVWFNSTDNVMRYYDGAAVITVGAGGGIPDAEAVQDIVGAMLADSATVDFTYNDTTNTVTATVLDSPTLQGQNRAQIETAIVASIVDSAPDTLDTLNALAEALGNDPNLATTLTNLIATKAQGFEASLTGGATSEVVTHNLGTRAVVVSVYVDSGSYAEEEYIVEHTSINTITIRSEGGNIPSGRKVVILAKGA
jgi:hypothetical protein